MSLFERLMHQEDQLELLKRDISSKNQHALQYDQSQGHCDWSIFWF